MGKVIEFKKKKKVLKNQDVKLERLAKVTELIADEINNSKNIREAHETILLLQAFLFKLSQDNQELRDKMYIIIQKFVNNDMDVKKL